MGKYAYAVMMVFSIEFALWLFGGTNYSTTSLFGILFDPTTLESNPLYSTIIIVALAAFAASAIIPGNLWSINIYALYAGIAVVFIGFSLSIVHLWQFVYGELSGMLTIELATPITILIIAPILTFYIITTVEWVRSNT